MSTAKQNKTFAVEVEVEDDYSLSFGFLFEIPPRREPAI
jgi:hypothetical protein